MPRVPTNKQGGGGGGREGRGGEGGGGGGRGSVSGRWQGNWPPPDIAPGSQALRGDLKKANEKKDKQKIEYLLHKTNQEQPAKEIKHAQIKSITIKLLMHVQMYLIIAQRSKRSLWPSFIKFNRWDLNPSCSQPGVILEHPSSWHYSDCIVTIQAKPLYLYIDFSCLLVTHLVGYTIVCNGRNGLVR